MKTILLGDAMIPVDGFVAAYEKELGQYGEVIASGNFEDDWDQLQYRRLEVEKNGPEIEEADQLVLENGQNADSIMGLFVPISEKVMEAMPNLRLVGVSRAGTENVNVEEATKRDILVINVQGRNAHAVSDYTVGMMLAEARNIARGHYSIVNGGWRKEFSNGDYIPEIGGKTIGLVGFGHIGQLVAQKLSGFKPEKVIVYDPYTSAEVIAEGRATKVESLEEVMSESDFISVHARLSDDNKGMIGEHEISLMKKTAIFVNTARAGLIDYNALTKALEEEKILGAALDVFPTEPLPEDDKLRQLDNVTLTTHVAGTTADVLTNSPYLLAEDVAKLFKDGEKPSFIVNPEVLESQAFKSWLAEQKA